MLSSAPGRHTIARSPENILKRLFKGRSNFLSDLYASGMHYAVTVRSPVAHGRLVSVTARDLGKDIHLITAADIPGRNRIDVLGDSMPVLADKTVRYIGEPIAVLVGPDQEHLFGALDQVHIDIEPGDARFSVLDVPAVPGISGLSVDDEQLDAGVEPDLRVRRGDVDQAFRDSAHIIEGVYHTGSQAHMYGEPQGAYATFEESGRMLVYASSQWPHHVHAHVCAVLGRKPKDCRVIRTELEVSLDSKLYYPSLRACHAALAALSVGKPVKLLYSQEEDFLYSPKRSPMKIRHEWALNADSTLGAARIRIDIDFGAYKLCSREMLRRVAVAALGLYSTAHLELEVRGHTSNIPPQNILAGFGDASSYFAAELHAARVIEVAEQSPVEWRRQHLSTPGQHPLTGSGRDNANCPLIIESLIEMSDFSRKHAAYELQRKRRRNIDPRSSRLGGIGIALGSQGAGFSGRGEADVPNKVSVRLDTDAKAQICTSIAGDVHTQLIWKQIVEEHLGVAPEDVEITAVDTSRVPDSGPATLSRKVAIVHKLIRQCCAAIAKARFRSPLPKEVKRSFRYPAGRKWNEEEFSGTPYVQTSDAGAVVELEFDTVTYTSRIKTVWLVVDAGEVLHPDQARSVVEAGVFQAIGWATREVVTYSDGQLNRDQFQAYSLYPMTDPPALKIEFLPAQDREGPRSLGELAFHCVPAAIAMALSQASGAYIDSIPATPSRVYDYLAEVEEDDE